MLLLCIIFFLLPFALRGARFAIDGMQTVEDIQLMRRIVGPKMGVKASGGVRTYADAVKMIEAGATRIGASASIAIVTGAPASSGSY